MKPSQLPHALALCYQTKRPAFLWGPPGIYKSQIMAQFAEANGYELRDVRATLIDPTDLKGFPVVAKDQMSWVPPDFLPKSNSKTKGILFLDELNQALPAVQAACYSLVLDRRIGNYIVPDGWLVVAAGNRASDRSGVYSMPAALSNRFLHLNCEVDNNEWLEWASKADIHPLVRAYVTWRPANLVTSEMKAGVHAFPTPRSWSFVSELLHGAEEVSTPDAILTQMVMGTVGDGVGIEFVGFMKESQELPSIDKIMKDPTTADVPNKAGSRYAVIEMLKDRATKDNLDKLLKYVSRMSKEFETVFMQGVSRDREELTETKTFLTWIRENRAALLPA